ncbi:MAG: Bug family tripartite tricarboxylate transporter substrate binding protein [Limnohabitans sp.]
MTLRWTQTLIAAALLASTACLAPIASAQSYPNKPITLVVPFGPGSGTDQMARVIAQGLGDALKVPVVVDNKGGASGFIAAQYVAKAAPDGYTLMLTTNTTQSANEHLFKKLPYDPVKDFTPITLLATGQMLLLVRPDSPYTTQAELIAAAKKAPGKLNFGAGSSSSQVASELLKQMANIDAAYVPYKSNPLAMTDLIGGQIDFMFADAPTAVPQVQGGKLRALAASGNKRLSATPDVPTVEQAGIKGYDMSYWFAVYAPAGVPPALVQQLNQTLAKVAKGEAFISALAKSSGMLALSTPEGLAQFQAEDSKKWGTVIRAAGIVPQ